MPTTSILMDSHLPDVYKRQAMLFPAMVETYAILALLISFLAVNGIQV